MKSRFKKIAITTGNVRGIGLEVTAKALAKLPASIKKNKALFFIFRHESQSRLQPVLFTLIDKKWARIVVPSLEDGLSYVKHHRDLADNTIIDIALNSNEAVWIVDVANACAAGTLSSMVTGPISKDKTKTLKSNPVGHTGIFRMLFPEAHLHMAFVGRDFNVLLSTDHVAVKKVESKLLSGEFRNALRSAVQLRQMLGDKRRIAVLGLNPHAGEKGIIGRVESKLFRRLPAQFEGPLVPDAAFLKKNWKKYSLFVCLYHDQGLIPFKMHHGQDSGVHVTVGLPFIRTSVDHGTAEDIFNKNLANPASMLEAIQLNLRFSGVKHV